MSENARTIGIVLGKDVVPGLLPYIPTAVAICRAWRSARGHRPGDLDEDVPSEPSNGMEIDVLRAALVAACWRGADLKITPLHRQGYDVLAFGEAAYDALARLGYDHDDIVAAGDELLGPVSRVVVTGKEVREAANPS